MKGLEAALARTATPSITALCPRDFIEVTAIPGAGLLANCRSVLAENSGSEELVAVNKCAEQILDVDGEKVCDRLNKVVQRNETLCVPKPAFIATETVVISPTFTPKPVETPHPSPVPTEISTQTPAPTETETETETVTPTPIKSPTPPLVETPAETPAETPVKTVVVEDAVVPTHSLSELGSNSDSFYISYSNDKFHFRCLYFLFSW
jgi:hypothetical protein